MTKNYLRFFLSYIYIALYNLLHVVFRLVGLLGFGEGWHNNHHAFEYSARHGLEWWEIDFGWYVIMFLQAIGVATHVKEPLQDHKKKLAMDEIKFI